MHHSTIHVELDHLNQRSVRDDAAYDFLRRFQHYFTPVCIRPSVFFNVSYRRAGPHGSAAVRLDILVVAVVVKNHCNGELTIAPRLVRHNHAFSDSFPSFSLFRLPSRGLDFCWLAILAHTRHHLSYAPVSFSCLELKESSLRASQELFQRNVCAAVDHPSRNGVSKTRATERGLADYGVRARARRR